MKILIQLLGWSQQLDEMVNNIIMKALGGFVKPNIIMKTLDDKSVEFSSRLSNQRGTYTKGEIETAYVRGATESEELESGQPGTFGQAIASMQRGNLVTRQVER